MEKAVQVDWESLVWLLALMWWLGLGSEWK